MGFIDDLYQGNLDAFETFHPPTAKYSDNSKKRSKCEEKLRNLLSGEELSLFETFCIASENIHSAHYMENFRAGFRLGAKMMMDVLQQSDNFNE